MIKIATECGQRWWRLSSWRRWDSSTRKYKSNVYIRRFRDGSGFAIGPIMFWRTSK